MSGVLAPRPARFYFPLVCWGAELCDYICRFMIPSLLAPGNIPALRQPSEAKFLLATTREDWLRLNREPIFRRLRESIAVEAIWDDGIAPTVHKYRRMSNGHAALADLCYRDGAVAINLNPDTIFPDGCVAEAQRLAVDEARDVVLCAAVRFDQDGILAELERTRRLGFVTRPYLLRNSGGTGSKFRSMVSAPNFASMSRHS